MIRLTEDLLNKRLFIMDNQVATPVNLTAKSRKQINQDLKSNNNYSCFLKPDYQVEVKTEFDKVLTVRLSTLCTS